uniref:Uncharacterized protein n=1 Tax=Lactuca sativa TaxID=4236 RepID=A0A9R1UJ68_LACSA|nr:hypothetical protein LSAT_V11C900491190 [Lactuca sativa]
MDLIDTQAFLGTYIGLSGWKAKKTIIWRAPKINSTSFGKPPTYFFSLFFAPTGVLSYLGRITIRFLWRGSDDNRKIRWIAWEKVIIAK